MSLGSPLDFDNFFLKIPPEVAELGYLCFKKSLNPGVSPTGLQKRSGLSEQEFFKILGDSKTTPELGRVWMAEEVANTIAFLTSFH